MNEGFSGDGNAIYTYPRVSIDQDLEKNIHANFSEHIKMVAEGLSEDLFLEKFSEMGGIVEVFLEGELKMSPSV